MVRFLPFVAALVTLGVTAGAPLSPSKAAATGNDEQGLHGRRTSSYSKKYCDSHDCPWGYTLVDDAKWVKCKRGKCTDSKCCEKEANKYCDSHDCPKHYELVNDAKWVECKDGKCTDSKCCEKDTKYCDSYDCPKHYSLRKNADEIKCSYSGCTRDKCCDYH